jgi:hypothetical protein
MRLFHGTSATLADSIQREGLLASGAEVFLAGTRERALFYARARAAGSYFEQHADGEGLIVEVGLDPAGVMVDTWHRRVPDQFYVRGLVGPAAIVNYERVAFGLWDLGKGVLSHVALERARRAGQQGVFVEPTYAELRDDWATARALIRRQAQRGRVRRSRVMSDGLSPPLAASEHTPPALVKTPRTSGTTSRQRRIRTCDR